MQTPNAVRRLAVSAAVVAAAVLLQPIAPASAQQVLRFHTFVPPVSASFKNVSAWAKKVEKESGGAVKFQMYPSMQLGGKPPDLYTQTKDGVVDITYTIPGYSPGVFPRSEVIELPFICSTTYVCSLAFTELYFKYFVEEYKDVHPIVFWTPGEQVLHVKGKPIRTLEDLQNRKVRIPSRLVGEMLKELGAVPVGITGANITEAMLRGVVEVMTFPWSIARANKVIDSSESHTVALSHEVILMMAMNKKSYERLPPAARKAVDSNSHYPTARWFATQWVKDDQPGIQRAKKLGHEIIRLSDAERARWREKSEPVVAQWIDQMTKAGHPAKEMVAETRRLVAKYEKEEMEMKKK